VNNMTAVKTQKNMRGSVLVLADRFIVRAA